MTTTFARSTAITAIGLLAALACAVSPPQSQARTTGECSGVVKGAPWSYKGQKGTTYMVVGVNGVSCAVGLKFMPKWTRTRGAYDLKPVPAGWHCSAVGDYTHLAKVGQCTTTKGGIFEWLPKTKK